MSCPAADWRALVAHRLDPRQEEPAGWPEALAHLGGCAECRSAAFAADPTLVFLRLAGPPASAEVRGPGRGSGHDAAEVEAVRGAVAAMRAASRLERAQRPGRLAGWWRWAAAAMLALAALSSGRQHELPAGRVEGALQPLGISAAGIAAVELPSAPAADAPRMPVLEELNRPGARVHQMEGPDISVVMMFDEGFDV